MVKKAKAWKTRKVLKIAMGKNAAEKRKENNKEKAVKEEHVF